MIRGLEKELKGVEVSEIMVSTPVPDLSTPTEVITITEDEIVATMPKTSVQRSVLSAKEEEKKETSSHAETEPEKTEESPSVASEPSSPVTENDEKAETVLETPQVEEEETTVSTQQEETPPLNAQHSTLNADKFTELVSKIYDRNYELGSCFEKNIEFESFADNKLTWNSTAEGEDKKQLINNWGLINMFVKDLFGYETKIVNIAKKKTNNPERSVADNTPAQHHTETANTPAATTHPDAIHNDADSGSMIEDIEMKSSCIAPEAGDTEAAKEKDPSTLLEEPMVKAAMELLNPKKVRIKKNV